MRRGADRRDDASARDGKELADLDRETRNFLEEEVGIVNAAGRALGLSFVIVR
jgi:hypothetical protein